MSANSMLVSRQPDGTFTVMPLDVEQITWERNPYADRADTHVTIAGWLAEGRVWAPGDDLPFEQPAIEQMAPQVGGAS